MNFEKIFSTLPKEGYAVFDFDNTCIVNDIYEPVFAHLCEHSLLKKGNGKDTFLRYFQLLEEGHHQQAYEFAVSALAGFTVNEVKELVRKVVSLEGTAITTRELFGIQINKGLQPNTRVVKLFDYFRQNTIQIWVVSASPKIVVEEGVSMFFPNYNIKCLGMENVVENGVLLDTLVRPTSTFQGKVDNIQKHISKTKKPVLGVGDSLNDREMLEYSEVQVVINRNNGLAKLAKEKRWFLL